ncbi:uncharacterized protein [Diadema setosum]|uniref:uncharacterized protein n=1 Tax=Diadema setosum TaxID=31175 RepID=UPI003B3B339A
MLETVAEGIKTPSELELRQSDMEPTLIGVWAKKTVRKGRTYGPFAGEKKDCNEVSDDTYSWEIRGPKGVRLYSIDASDPTKANWMRYVKSARSYDEQNMIATQYKRNIYYRTLRAILPGEELMCWYKNIPPKTEGTDTEESDGALNTSGESGTSGAADMDSTKSEGDDRQMPILEKMEMPEMSLSQLDSTMSTESENRAKVPAHLDVPMENDLDDKVAEPPLISPIYPSNGHHAANFASITAEGDAAGIGETNVQIQAPDISSSDATAHLLPSLTEGGDQVDPDTTSLAVIESGDKGPKKSRADIKKQIRAQPGIKKKARVGQKIPLKRPLGFENKKYQSNQPDKRVNKDGITEAVIGPDCVSVLPDGSELFGCMFCPKKCRFPNGLKLHLMLKHHIPTVTVDGVNTSKWGKGLGPGDIKKRKKSPVAENGKSPAGRAGDQVSHQSTQGVKPDSKSPNKEQKKGMFMCELCNRSFMYATWRDKHLLRHKADMNKELFTCSDCPRRFVTEGDLNKHRLTHRTKIPGKSEGGAKLEANGNILPGKLRLSDSAFQGQSRSDPTNDAAAKVVNDSKLDKSSVQVIQSRAFVASSSTGVVSGGTLLQVEQLPQKRRNVTSRKGMLKKVASCTMCGIEFVSSSNLHRHLRRRHGIIQAGKKSSAPMTASVNQSEEMMRKEVNEVVNQTVKTEKIEVKPTVSQESLLTVPKFSAAQTKGHMKNLASMTRMIRRKHATAVLQNMLIEKKIGAKDSKVDQLRMRARLHAALKQGKSLAVKRHQQGFKRIEQVASRQPQDVPSIICPWQSDVKPGPYIPIKPPSNKTEVPSTSAGTSSNCVEVLDLRVKKSSSDGTQKVGYPSSIVFDPSKPVDLSCHSRPVIQIPTYQSTKRPKITVSVPAQEVKTITKINITSRMKSTGWKSSTLANPLESLDLERTTKFSVLDAAITCNVCEVPFDSMKLLTQHVVAHAEDFPYKCEFCVKLFETTDLLASHRYGLHRVGKMFCCSECQQEFAYLSNLKQHQADMHADQACSYTERGPEEIRPQNFTDPTKAIQTPPILPEPRERISLIAHEMSKVSPSRFGRFSAPAHQDAKGASPRKQPTRKKDVPCNPQRHHPFAHAREIGYLSTLSDNKNVSHYEMATNNRCTKCARVFGSTADLHVHIMECASVVTATKPKPKTPVKTPPKSVEKKKAVQEARQKNVRARKLKMQAAKRSKKKAVQKVNESDESDAAQKRKRARPGLKMYNPLNHTRRRASANIDDVHACQGCGKQFHFINGLERHMKLCPNKDKLFNKNANPNLAPRNMNHQCAYCARQFVYLRSLKKHISSCPKRPSDAPTTVPIPAVVVAVTTSSTTSPTATKVASSPGNSSSTPTTAVSHVAESGVTVSTPKGSTTTIANAERKSPIVSPPSQGASPVERKVEEEGAPDKAAVAANGTSVAPSTPKKPRRRRRRVDPYSKKKRSRSASPRTRSRPNNDGEEMEGEEEEEGDEEEEEEEEEEQLADGEKEGSDTLTSDTPTRMEVGEKQGAEVLQNEENGDSSKNENTADSKLEGNEQRDSIEEEQNRQTDS